MEKIYKRFEGCSQILSYRFGSDLFEPIHKTDTKIKEDGTMLCSEHVLSNYGQTSTHKERIAFVMPEKEFKIENHLEVANGSCTDA